MINFSPGPLSLG